MQQIKKILRKPGKLTHTPTVNTKKLCVSKYFIERSQGQHKKSSRRVGKSSLTNSGNLLELL